MNGLISLISKALNLKTDTPDYTISDGSRVAVIGTELLTHNVKAGALGTVRGFSKYPMRSEPIISNPPIITHAIVEFPSTDSDVLKFAIPLSSLRSPSFGEAVTGTQTPESYTGRLNHKNSVFQSLPRPLSTIASEVQEILYGLVDTKIYKLVWTVSDFLSALPLDKGSRSGVAPSLNDLSNSLLVFTFVLLMSENFLNLLIYVKYFIILLYINFII
jgi:hypothetical protein